MNLSVGLCMKIFGLIFLLLVVSLTAHSQTNLTLPVYKRILSFDYENDLFARTDRYYSQGLHWNYSFLQNPTKQQFRTKPVRGAFSISLTHEVFTPSTIRKDSALHNDRPYAAFVSGQLNYLIIDTIRKYSISAGLELGIIGPLAQGKEMQTAIHKATNNFIPLGWEYQIANGLILDANFGAEKSIIKTRNIFQAIGRIDCRFGTFQTNVRPSLLLMFGSLKRYRGYFYAQSALRLVGYDGTLEGSLAGGKSPVTVSTHSINRLIGEEELGFRFQTDHFGMSIHYSIQSQTFQYQKFSPHAWGGVGLFWKF